MCLVHAEENDLPIVAIRRIHIHSSWIVRRPEESI